MTTGSGFCNREEAPQSLRESAAGRRPTNAAGQAAPLIL